MITPKSDQHFNELSLLGYLMLTSWKRHLVGDAFAVCPADAFTFPETKALAVAMAHLAQAGTETSLVNICQQMREDGSLRSVNAAYVAEIIHYHGNAILSDQGALRTAAAIADERRRTAALPEVTALARLAQTPGTSPCAIVEALQTAAANMETALGFAPASLAQQLDEYIAALNAPEMRLPPVRTPWRGLNGILRGGFLPGELVILAARPSVGKTAFATNCAYSVSCTGQKAVFQSLEMPREQLLDRLVANIGGIDLGRLREGLNASEQGKAREAADKMRCKPLLIFDDAKVTVDDIQRRVRAEQRGNSQVGLVVVDYLQLLMPQTTKNQNREREVAEMSRAFKLMAKELRVPVLVLAQLNRRSEEMKRPPMLSDLRESGSIEQDADIVIFLHQARQTWHADEPVEIIVAKGRSSGVGKTHLVFNRRHQRFMDSTEATYVAAVKGEETEQRGHWQEKLAEL